MTEIRFTSAYFNLESSVTFLATNFSVDDFDRYDRLDGIDNGTAGHLHQRRREGECITTSHTPLQQQNEWHHNYGWLPPKSDYIPNRNTVHFVLQQIVRCWHSNTLHRCANWVVVSLFVSSNLYLKNHERIVAKIWRCLPGLFLYFNLWSVVTVSICNYFVVKYILSPYLVSLAKRAKIKLYWFWIQTLCLKQINIFEW